MWGINYRQLSVPTKSGLFCWFLYLLFKQVQIYILLAIPLKLHKINS